MVTVWSSSSLLLLIMMLMSVQCTIWSDVSSSSLISVANNGNTTNSSRHQLVRRSADDCKKLYETLDKCIANKWGLVMDEQLPELVPQPESYRICCSFLEISCFGKTSLINECPELLKSVKDIAEQNEKNIWTSLQNVAYCALNGFKYPDQCLKYNTNPVTDPICKKHLPCLNGDPLDIKRIQQCVNNNGSRPGLQLLMAIMTAVSLIVIAF